MDTDDFEGQRAHAPCGSTLERGLRAEDVAWAHLRRAGLVLLARNYRVARGPHAHGGEIDLIAREADGTVVFVEVRSRRDGRHGGAAGSVDPAKQRRLVRTARHFLARLPRLPYCRFDVVSVEGEHVQWIRGAFDER